MFVDWFAGLFFRHPPRPMPEPPYFDFGAKLNGWPLLYRVEQDANKKWRVSWWAGEWCPDTSITQELDDMTAPVALEEVIELLKRDSRRYERTVFGPEDLR